MLGTRIGLRQFITLNLLFLSIIWASIFYLNRPLYVEGPQLQIYLAAKNVIAGGGLHLDYYDSYHELIVQRSRENHSQFWQDVYAIDRDGRRIAKHSHLMIAATVPFLFIFGDIGILILGALSHLGLQSALYLLVKEWIGEDPTMLSALLLICATPFILFASTLSYDLLAATLIVLGVYLGRRWPLLAGALMGLTLFIRPSNLLYAPLFLFFSKRLFPTRVWLVTGFAASVAAFLFCNNLFWGGPLVTAHTRMPFYINGAPEFATTPTSFTLRVFLGDWMQKLFSLKAGFLPYNLALLPLLCAPAVWRKLRYHGDFLLLLATSVVQMLLIFAYDGWPASSGGNRYLLPASGLLAILSIVVLEQLWSERQSKRLPTEGGVL